MLTQTEASPATLAIDATPANDTSIQAAADGMTQPLISDTAPPTEEPAAENSEAEDSDSTEPSSTAASQSSTSSKMTASSKEDRQLA